MGILGEKGGGSYNAVFRGVISFSTRCTEGDIFPLWTKLTEMNAYGRTINAHSHDGDWTLRGLMRGITSGTGDFGIVDMAIMEVMTVTEFLYSCYKS
jgi:hypothetical protein